MKRLCDVPTLKEPTEAPYSAVRTWPMSPPALGPDPSDVEDLDDFGKALAHMEDAQEVLIFLQTEEVKRLVPIPVWNLLVRTEQRLTRFIDDHSEWDEVGDDRK